MRRWTLQRWLIPITIASILAIGAGGFLASSPGTQWRIVRQIRGAGGSVGITPPNGTGWLAAIRKLMPDAFGEVHQVKIANIPIRRSWLLALRDWKHLNQVWLNRTGITDADLRLLADHRDLYFLCLNGNPITEQGVRNLGKLPSLYHLELNWTRVTKLDAIEPNFGKLGVLKLRGIPINDVSFKTLTPMFRLHELDLSRTAITDRSLKGFSIGPNVTYVDLEGTRTTLEGARNLQKLHTDWAIRASNSSLLPKIIYLRR